MSARPQLPRLLAARQREARLLLLVFLLALCVRLAYAYQIRDLPTLHQLVMDAERYDREARELLDHGWWPRQVFFQAPLYPYLLAAVYALFGRSLAAVRLLQAVVGAATALLAAVAAARLATGAERTGAAATGAERTDAVATGAERTDAAATGVAAAGAEAASGSSSSLSSPAISVAWGRSPAWGGRETAAAGAAGVLAALYAPAVFYTPLLLKTVPLLFLEAVAAVLLLPPRGERLSLTRAGAAGLALGTAALLQENLLLVALAAALFLLVAGPGPAPRRGWPAGALALAIAAALPMVPVTLVNYRVGGELVMAGSRGGMNFYIGNHRGASGTYMPLSSGSQTPDQMLADGRRLAAGWKSRDTARPVTPGSITPAQASALFWRESRREIAADPLAWARLMLRKTRLFWNGYEIPDSEGFRVVRRESTVLRLDPVVFGLIAPLAAVGCLAAVRRGGAARRAALLLALLTGATWLAVVLFFIFGRYRLMVVPFLLPLAGAGLLEVVEIAELVERVKGRRRERDARPATRAFAFAFAFADVALLALAGLAVNLPCYSAAEKRQQDSAIVYNLGHAGIRWSAERYGEFLRAAKGAGGAETPEARESFAQAVTLASRAVGDFTEAAAASPGFFAAELERAAALERKGSYEATAGRLAPALADYGEAHRGLTAALAAGAPGANPELLEEARRMLGAIDSGTASALNNLGGHLIEGRQLEHAEEALRRAVALAPRGPAPRGNLALCWFQRGLAARRGGAEGEAARFFHASREAYRQAVELAAAAGRGDQAALYRQGVALADAELTRRPALQ